MKHASLLLIAVCGLLIANGSMTVGPAAAATDNYTQDALGADRQKAERLVEKIGLTETLGPLAPVAMSPFFGLACLSGTSMLCRAGVLPENEFLQGNEVLSNGLVFLAFAALAVATSVPRLVSTSKVFAEAMDRVETYAGIIAYGVILMAARSAVADPETVVYAAGFFTVTHTGLLAIAAAVNIFVISTVRLFFELLVLISPIPTLDAMFECANKTVAGILICIYAFNPYMAFVLNAVLFLLCLIVFRWVNRRLKYLKAVLLEPMLVGLVRSVLGRPQFDPDHGTLRRLRRLIGDADLAVRCFPMRKIGPFKTKDRCYLAFADDGVSLVKFNLIRPAQVHPLTGGALSGTIDEGLLAYSVTVADDDKPCELVFGRVYTPKRDAIANRWAAASAPGEPTAPRTV